MAKLEYYRWWDERLLELQRRIFEAVKQQLPEAVVFSPNYYFSDGIEAHDYIKVASYADIFLCVALASAGYAIPSGSIVYAATGCAVFR